MSFRLFDFAVDPITLECGVRLPALPIRGWVWGPEGDWPALAQQVDVVASTPRIPIARTHEHMAALPVIRTPLRAVDCPTVLIVHALTGDAHVGGSDGWWGPLVGPGRPLDPNRMRILCFNNLGSCYGTYGPDDAGFPTREGVVGTRIGAETKGGFVLPEHRMPAPITTWDSARVLWRAVDALGIEHIHSVIGGSVGGMIALCFAALNSQRVGQVLPIAASAAASPWIVGWNHVARQLLVSDPSRGLALARQIAHMTYRAEAGLEIRHGRSKASGGEGLVSPYAVQTYLEHQGRALCNRFTVGAYLAQLDCMDNHDLARRPRQPDPNEQWVWTPKQTQINWGLHRLECDVHALSILEDQLYFTGQSDAFVTWLQHNGRQATHDVLSNPHGHDGFLIDTDSVGTWLTKQLSTLYGG